MTSCVRTRGEKNNRLEFFQSSLTALMKLSNIPWRSFCDRMMLDAPPPLVLRPRRLLFISISIYTPIFNFWHRISVRCNCNVMQRGIPQVSQIVTLLRLATSRGLPTLLSLHRLRTMYAGCFSWCRLHMPWGSKKGTTETELPEVSANHLCCAISLTRSWIQESPLAIVPGTTFAEGPKRYEVRHLGRFTSYDLSDGPYGTEIAWKLKERRTNKNWLLCCHRESGSNPCSIGSFSHPSSVPECSHWSCTEDYSSMRGSLNSAFVDCRTID